MTTLSRQLTPLIIAITAATGHISAEVTLFPAPNKTLSAETMPYTQMLHTGKEAGEFYMRGRFAVDFPAVEYDYSDIGLTRNTTLGITAAAHINMLPTSNMRFPVDNFYAVLAIRFSGVYGDSFSWRLYPVYHVSAHLADGYPRDILKSDVRPVSSEMVRAEAYYKPLGDLLEIGAGAGWYYHVCAQKELKYRGDISILITPALSTLNGLLQPYALLRAENVVQGGHNPGADISVGIIAQKNNRGFGLSLRYFNKLHSSYYFESYEKGWGVEYIFIY